MNSESPAVSAPEVCSPRPPHDNNLQVVVQGLQEQNSRLEAQNVCLEARNKCLEEAVCQLLQRVGSLEDRLAQSGQVAMAAEAQTASPTSVAESPVPTKILQSEQTTPC